jgi:hypothetical protein
MAMLLKLYEFLRFGGPEWTGPLGVDLASPARRAARHVLLNLAVGLPSRLDRAHLGAELGWAALGGQEYSESAVDDAVKLLVAAGLVQRKRAKEGRGSRREGVARTFVNPFLIETAIAWADARTRLRRARCNTKTTCGRIELPLAWPGQVGVERSAAFDTALGKPKLGAGFEGDGAIGCTPRAQSMDSGVHTPPRQGQGGE